MNTGQERHMSDLTAAIVAAYVERNTLRPEELPDLIAQVYSAMAGTQAAPAEPKESPREPAVSVRKVRHAGLHRVPGVWKEVQVHPAASGKRARHDPGRVSHQMGAEGRLYDDCAELL